jgi:hypothetical protein
MRPFTLYHRGKHILNDGWKLSTMSNRKRHILVHELLTATAPPLKTASTPVYRLDQYHLRRATTLVTVQLVGIRGHEKRTETSTFPLLQGVPEAELVRAAVWLSPHRWTVSSGMHFSQVQHPFTSPLDAHLLTARIHPQETQSTGAHSQPQPPQELGDHWRGEKGKQIPWTETILSN